MPLIRSSEVVAQPLPDQNADEADGRWFSLVCFDDVSGYVRPWSPLECWQGGFTTEAQRSYEMFSLAFRQDRLRFQRSPR